MKFRTSASRFKTASFLVPTFVSYCKFTLGNWEARKLVEWSGECATQYFESVDLLKDAKGLQSEI
jgi:hypothetical protein